VSKSGKLILIEWNDSNVLHGWRLNDIGGDDVAHCRTVGILQGEDEAKITVAFGDSDCESVMETITIPRGCITAIKELRIK